jgi:hypothetical protein
LEESETVNKIIHFFIKKSQKIHRTSPLTKFGVDEHTTAFSAKVYQKKQRPNDMSENPKDLFVNIARINGAKPLEMISIEKPRYTQWLYKQFPDGMSRVEELWDLPVRMHFRTDVEGPEVPLATQLLALQSQTGERVVPRGTVLFIGHPEDSISEELFAKLEESLK